jgi:hypothetical protein
MDQKQALRLWAEQEQVHYDRRYTRQLIDTGIFARLGRHNSYSHAFFSEYVGMSLMVPEWVDEVVALTIQYQLEVPKQTLAQLLRVRPDAFWKLARDPSVFGIMPLGPRSLPLPDHLLAVVRVITDNPAPHFGEAVRRY